MERADLEGIPELQDLLQGLRAVGLADLAWSVIGGRPAAYKWLLSDWKLASDAAAAIGKRPAASSTAEATAAAAAPTEAAPDQRTDSELLADVTERYLASELDWASDLVRHHVDKMADGWAVSGPGTQYQESQRNLRERVYSALRPFNESGVTALPAGSFRAIGFPLDGGILALRSVTQEQAEAGGTSDSSVATGETHTAVPATPAIGMVLRQPSRYPSARDLLASARAAVTATSGGASRSTHAVLPTELH